MRGIPPLALVLVLAGAAARPVEPRISVAGTYRTAVTLERSSCKGQQVETHPTVVTHQPGDTIVVLTHAGSSYTGVLARDGSFTTPPVTQRFGEVSYRIGIVGRFSRTGMDALVTVEAGVTPPCSFAARWAGPREAGENVIP